VVTPNNPTPQSGSPTPQQGQGQQQGLTPQQQAALPQMQGVNFGALVLALQKAASLAPDIIEIVTQLVDALTAQQGVHAAGPQKQAHPHAAACCDDTIQCLCEALAHALKARECCR
jgi:hypothetical protein